MRDLPILTFALTPIISALHCVLLVDHLSLRLLFTQVKLLTYPLLLTIAEKRSRLLHSLLKVLYYLLVRVYQERVVQSELKLLPSQNPQVQT